MTQDSGATVPAPPPPKLLYSSFGMGMLSVTLLDLYGMLVTLFAISIGATPAEIGLLAGARSMGPALFSMHGGSMVDRLGTRRVLLTCSAITAGVAMMIPALPWFWPLFVFQLVTGLLTTFNWIGSQTLVAQLCRGDAGTLGRFNFFIRLGTIGGPILAGALWDYAGPWITFAAIACCGAMLHLLARFVPEQNEDVAQAPPAPITSFLPRVSDYTRSIKLMLIPAICFTIVVSTLRNGNNGIQLSTYLVYLKELGYQGTAIGALYATAETSLALASLFVGTAKRMGPSEWVLLGTSVLAILAVSSAPLIGHSYLLLMLAQAVIGGAQGFMQPIMFSIQSTIVGKEFQGAVVGLRLTANRGANLIMPPIAGYLAEVAGLENSFLLVGLMFLIAAVVVGIVIARWPAFRMKP